MIHWPSCLSKTARVISLLTSAFFLSIQVNVTSALETRDLKHLFDLTHAEQVALSLPTDVAIAPDGRIYVVDGSNHRIAVFDKAGRFLNVIGAKGSADGQFLSPIGITVDKKGNVYIADSGNYRIQIFNDSGGFIRKIKLREKNRKIKPIDVAINQSKKILYITGNNNHKVMRYSTRGKFLGSWGKKGNNPREFRYPATITVSDEGLVYVVDVLNSRIQIFESNGKLSTTAGSWGVLPGQLFRPKGVALGRKDQIYVSDSYMDLIEVYDNKTKFSHVLGKDNKPHKFVTPAGITIDKHNRIYVTEMLNNKVSVYQLLKD